MSVDHNSIEQTDYRARLFVNGLTDEIDKDGQRTGKKIIHTANWAPAFRDHPTVKQAEREGWGRELRSHCVMAVTRAMFAGRPHHVIESLMPDAKWIDHTRQNAERYALAKEWRDEVIAKHGSMDAFLSRGSNGKSTARPLGSVMTPAFGNMQKTSPNRSLHRTKEGLLTDISKRMSGDSE